jgi:hypothetical protein
MSLLARNLFSAISMSLFLGMIFTWATILSAA